MDAAANPFPRVFCIGRNYAAHAREMKSEIPESPVVFTKPSTSIVRPGRIVQYPKHGSSLHHEAEVVVQIGRAGQAHSREDAQAFVGGVGLGLDLTLRDVQADLKQKGLPWEKSKAFDQSALLSEVTAYSKELDLHDIDFSCRVNGDLRQEGNTVDMLFDVERLIVEVSAIWSLLPGDLMYTGTPEGVGPLEVGDRVTVESGILGTWSWEIG